MIYFIEPEIWHTKSFIDPESKGEDTVLEELGYYEKFPQVRTKEGSE